MKRLLSLILISSMFLSVAMARGVTANTTITALATDVQLHYFTSTGEPTYKDSSDDLHLDWQDQVLAIHGIKRAPGTTLFSGWNDIGDPRMTGLDPIGSYTNLYVIENKSNEKVTVNFSYNLVSDYGHYVFTFNEPTATKNVAEDGLAYFEFDVEQSLAQAYERATLNTSVAIYETPSTLNIVSYNEFPSAIGDSSDGTYGGVESVNGLFLMETQGFDLTVLSRTAEIKAPTANGYSKSETDLVPGAKIIYTIVVKNNNNAIATGVKIQDSIPENCHEYTPDPATLTGANSFSGPVNDSGNLYFEEVEIPAQGTVTMTYTVTVD